MKYNVIYADPPWSFNDGIRHSETLKFRKLEDHYETMSLAEICSLPIKDIAENPCVLFLWTTDAHLEDAMSVISNWGFQYKTIGFIWNKKTKNGKQVCFMGKWTMKGSEICLLATRGVAHKLLKVFNVRQLVEAERGVHSQKPIEVMRRIEEMFGDVPKIELFARSKRAGWHTWGNELENDVEFCNINESWKSKLIQQLKHGLHSGTIKRADANELCLLMRENKPFRLLFNKNRGYVGIQYC